MSGEAIGSTVADVKSTAAVAAVTVKAMDVTLTTTTSAAALTDPEVRGSTRRAMAEEKPWAKDTDDDWYCVAVMPERVVVVCTTATARVMSPLVGLGGLITYLRQYQRKGEGECYDERLTR